MVRRKKCKSKKALTVEFLLFINYLRYIKIQIKKSKTHALSREGKDGRIHKNTNKKMDFYFLLKSSSNRTISSSPRYCPTCTSIITKSILPGFSSL